MQPAPMNLEQIQYLILNKEIYVIDVYYDDVGTNRQSNKAYRQPELLFQKKKSLQ